MELVVNPTAFSLLSQITVLSSEFHGERPSAQTDLTRWLWDVTEHSRGEHTAGYRKNHRSKDLLLTAFLTFINQNLGC